jgi:hypothetical protein
MFQSFDEKEVVTDWKLVLTSTTTNAEGSEGFEEEKAKAEGSEGCEEGSEQVETLYVLCGAFKVRMSPYHYLTESEFELFQSQQKKFIILQTELIHSSFLTNPGYIWFLNHAIEIWDYSYENQRIAHLYRFPHLKSKWLLKPYPLATNLKETIHYLQYTTLFVEFHKRPIDVLFVASPNPWRQSVMQEVHKKTQEKSLFLEFRIQNVFPDELIRLMNFSKVLLNIHLTNCKTMPAYPLESARIVPALELGLFVISEESNFVDMQRYFDLYPNHFFVCFVRPIPIVAKPPLSEIELEKANDYVFDSVPVLSPPSATATASNSYYMQHFAFSNRNQMGLSSLDFFKTNVSTEITKHNIVILSQRTNQSTTRAEALGSFIGEIANQLIQKQIKINYAM